jgi:predicted DCC family thiol-disulfide oxidoreductase YuxK
MSAKDTKQSHIDTMILTIFYDRNCPLCSAEINQLRALDNDKQLLFEDINAVDFIQRYPYIDKIKANKLLHGQLTNGTMLYGLDVTCLAWKTVGKHRWLAILRWPLIRWFADISYRFFARHRNTISTLLMARNNSLNCQRCKSPD